MSKIKMSGKCFQATKSVAIYTTEKQRQEDQVPTATVVQNSVLNNIASRRNKIRLQNDDMLMRKNKVRARLQQKLAAKKAKKSS